ncbi:hypothetical protein Lal_00042378 [Lupinus albus]|nr:hypothetical protein Lal_00042378 [Lupinus albus]
MAPGVPLISTIFVFLLLLVVTEMGPTMMEEARTCKSKSQRYKGSCYSDNNCAIICEGEGFTGGKCHGFFCKCWCKRPCLD